MANRLNSRRRKARRKSTVNRLEAIASNMRQPWNADDTKTLRKSRAYNPGAERLTPAGRCRVMHNVQGSKPVKSTVRRRFDNQ